MKMFSRKKISTFTGIAVLIILVLFSGIHSLTQKKSFVPDGLLTVHFIDVGQGDSILAVLPDGKTVLVDAGEKNQGSVIVDYLHNLGIKKIDYLIGTHPHADHIGGMAEVIDSIPVDSIYMPHAATNTVTYKHLLETIQSHQLSIHTAKAGMVLFDSPNGKAEFLGPLSEEYDDLNNSSAVLKLSYGATAYLLMGDAEKQVEQELLSSSADLQCNVLKLGHHGSSTSSTKAFLSAVSPQFAVISCGQGNDYGHPHKEVLKRLETQGILPLRTDQKGTVVLSSDGRVITERQ